MDKRIKKNNLISVIVPVYNVEQYLDKCVQSIMNQTYHNLEIILVDDGSPDECPRMCDVYALRDSRIKVIHKQNGGLSDARNAGIDVSHGEYITFIDSDDYVRETYVEYLLSLFDHAEQCLFTACNHFVVRGKNTTANFDSSNVLVLNQTEALEGILYHEKLDVSGWGKLYHKNLFKTLRYPKGHLYEDTYVIGDLIEMSPQIVCGPEPQYYYIQRENSIVNSGFSKSKLEFIESVDLLTRKALQKDVGLADACKRRKVHSYLSVLRYMKNCPKEYLPLRSELIQKVMELKDDVLKNPKTPSRDRLGIQMLSAGYPVFSFGWSLYERFRK